MKLIEYLITTTQTDLLQDIILKLSKVNDKEGILKTAREKRKVIYKGTAIRLPADFSETLQARREWNDILKIQKDKSCHPRILYPAKLSSRYEREIKAFPDNQNGGSS